MMAAARPSPRQEAPSGRPHDGCAPRVKRRHGMAWRQHRWFRRWLIVIVFWAVPVAIVAVREIREEMAYNYADLKLALTTWQLTDAQRAAGAAKVCRGEPDEARAAGCPADVLAANARRQQEARDEFTVRKRTLASYLWHAFVGYWIVPAAFLFACGVVIGLVRRALRRPPIKPPAKPPLE
ncbi:hypothetical protein D8O04_29685, partial [Burkholderia mallei]